MNAPRRSSFAPSLAALLAAGCAAVGPDYEPPRAEVPAAWREPPGNGGLAAAPAELAAWWTHFGDPVLDRLVERAARENLDLRTALARVREARALRGIAAGERLPSVDLDAAYQRRGDSENTPFGAFATEFDRYTISLGAAWEVDLWGRVRRADEAADADLGATIEDARDVFVLVAAETAAAYVDVRAFQRRLDVARTNVALQEQTLALVQARFDAGLVRERDVAQATTNVEATRSRVPALEAGLRAAENRLAVLLGRSPGEMEELARTAPIPVPPARVAVGVPADLLRRRADVRRAERVLAAETARIGVAEGDLYPRLSLLGSLGLEADHVGEVFDGDSRVFGIGPSLRWNLFDGGRLRNRVRAQDARAEQALLQWQSTVLTALEETENAMTAFVREQARRAALLAAQTQARRSVELARAQYRDGLSDFQPVLDSERTLAELEDEVAQSEAAIANSLVRLYRALGGGWEDGAGGAASS